MKFFVTLGIAFSVLFFGVAPLHAAPQKETPQQLQVRKHYLDALEQARVEYLAAEKKARAELKTAQKGAGKGKKASKKKTQALNAYNKEMKRIRAAFVAAKKDAKTEYAAAKSAPKDEASAAVTEQERGQENTLFSCEGSGFISRRNNLNCIVKLFLCFGCFSFIPKNFSCADIV